MSTQVVCGGTLGIFLAAALQLAGLRVAVVERGPLAGRAQEWNISRKEIAELVGCASWQPDCHLQRCVSVAIGSPRVDMRQVVLVNPGIGYRISSCWRAALTQVGTVTGEDGRADTGGGGTVCLHRIQPHQGGV